MGMIDKYTWMRWKESFWGQLAGELRKPLMLIELCRSSPKIRMISLVAVAAMLFSIYFLGVFFSPKPKAAVPSMFVFKKTDAAGVTWTLNFQPGQDFKSLAASPTKPGLPLTLGADIKQNPNYIRVQFYITGAAGEKYVPSVLKNNHWPEPPTAVVRNGNGDILTRQKMKFGGQGIIPLLWQIPPGFHGQVTFELEADFGPFEISRPPITTSF